MAMSAAAKAAMAKGREKTLQARKAKKEAARKRAAVAREARTGKKSPAKSTPKKWMGAEPRVEGTVEQNMVTR